MSLGVVDIGLEMVTRWVDVEAFVKVVDVRGPMDRNRFATRCKTSLMGVDARGEGPLGGGYDNLMQFVQQVVKHVGVEVEVVLSREAPSACSDGEVRSGKCTSLSRSLQL